MESSHTVTSSSFRPDPFAVAATPDAAAAVFGDRLPLAEAYVGLLADTGISHGLIGPREAPRLWDRHIFNCVATAPAFTAAREFATARPKSS